MTKKISSQTPTFPLGREAPVFGYDPWSLRVQDELKSLKPKPLQKLSLKNTSVEIRVSNCSVWIVAKWRGAHLALRPAFVPVGGLKLKEKRKEGKVLNLEVETPIGGFNILVNPLDPGKDLLRVTTTFTPSATIRFPYWPRDVYPIDSEGDPTSTRGVLHAAQRGSAAGVVYSTIIEPSQATFFYLQNLTWLNGFAQTTETELNTVVGGSWPEIGYRPPSSKDHAMTSGEEEEWSDFFIRFCPEDIVNEVGRARVFMDSLAAAYPHLPPPDTVYRDWPQRAQETLASLSSEKCWVHELDHCFLHPYVSAEYPDSMVQLVLLPPMIRYGKWAEREIPLVETLIKGAALFYDEEVKCVRRYLPTVGPDKDRNECDSWYLYHPLITLARLAKAGHQEAREILAKSLGYAIKTARHMAYNWPVTFNLLTLDIIRMNRKPGEPGQTDVPGLYAYLMLEARDVLGEEWFVEEAKRALQTLERRGFEVGYQFNNTAWGAVACARMWRETGETRYLDFSHELLANFFHNVILWEPDYGLTRNHSMFMGVTCLHDGAYTAMYEEYESFSAFHEYLKTCGNETLDSVHMMMTEYMKYLLSRGWYYYPSELPQEVLATEIRNGEIDRSLAFPLEDLYPERQPAGAVGQEIYGAGAAFDFVALAYHRHPKAPFIIFCEYPWAEESCNKSRGWRFRIYGAKTMPCKIRFLENPGVQLPSITVRTAGGKELHPIKEDHPYEFQTTGGAVLEVVWSESKRS